MILCFSATGNSRYVADRLAELVENGRKPIDLGPMLRDGAKTLPTLRQGESLGFVFPVNSWGLPKGMGKLLATLPYKGYDPTGTYVYMVCTCGDDAGLTARQWHAAIAQAGLQGDAAYSVFMPNTYVIMPGFDVDSDETARRKLSEAPEAIRNIAADIGRKRRGDLTYHGKAAAFKTSVIYPLFMQFYTNDRPFSADASRCTGCGHCAAVCPMGNISLSADSHGRQLPRWKHRCLTCLACYHGCPSHCIRYGSLTRHKGTYPGPDSPRFK